MSGSIRDGMDPLQSVLEDKKVDKSFFEAVSCENTLPCSLLLKLEYSFGSFLSRAAAAAVLRYHFLPQQRMKRRMDGWMERTH